MCVPQRGPMKLNALWILNVLANATRRTEKQKFWAKNSVLPSFIVRTRLLLSVLDTLPRGGGGGRHMLHE